MRFQLWAYKPDGYAQLAVVDTKFEDEFRVGRSGYVMVRDQSVYPEDNGRFVWKMLHIQWPLKMQSNVVKVF